MSVTEAINRFPVEMRGSLNVAYEEGGEMAAAMLDRGDMPPERALLSGLALNEGGRFLLEQAFEGYARPDRPLPTSCPEVVIGGGAHAAVYCAVRVAQGFPRPLVIEQDARYGGTFAMTLRSSFFLNSRNRPGPIGAVGSRDALNVIPGAMMQPSDLGGSEYQANADLGLVVRCTLTLFGELRTARVTSVSTNGPTVVVETDRGTVRTGRVIVATGIGKPRVFNGAPPDNRQSFSYAQFMQRFDQLPFPLKGLGRVAVVGDGDSGKTVIEALTGYGPYMGGSVASMDYVRNIDWYGKDLAGMTKERWIECNRTRYKPLAALFRKQDGTSTNARVRGLPKLQVIYKSLDVLSIDGAFYDTVIDCRGFETNTSWREMIGVDSSVQLDVLRSNPGGAKGVQLCLAETGKRLYVVGPAARLEFEQNSDPMPQIEENKVALFRLVPRTAALAQSLPGPDSSKF